MNDLIKSLKKDLLAFDKESTKRELTKREKKEIENLKCKIYWAKLKKLKADFERLILTDIQELANTLQTPLLEKNILLRTETHIKTSTRFFGPALPFYTIISICDKSLSYWQRWEKSPFLLIKGNCENNTIELFNVNQNQANVSSIIKKNVWNNPIVKFKIVDYNFALLESPIDKWLNRNMDQILNSKSRKKNKL